MSTQRAVEQMSTARTVKAELVPGWGLLTCWLQNECVHGYWVQFAEDGPYRLVEKIVEL
jgi:hypothetical protein